MITEVIVRAGWCLYYFLIIAANPAPREIIPNFLQSLILQKT
jgi:hypothetical protein